MTLHTIYYLIFKCPNKTNLTEVLLSYWFLSKYPSYNGHLYICTIKEMQLRDVPWTCLGEIPAPLGVHGLESSCKTGIKGLSLPESPKYLWNPSAGLLCPPQGRVFNKGETLTTATGSFPSISQDWPVKFIDFPTGTLHANLGSATAFYSWINFMPLRTCVLGKSHCLQFVMLIGNYIQHIE